MNGNFTRKEIAKMFQLQTVIGKPNMIQRVNAWTNNIVDVCGACPVDTMKSHGTNEMQSGFSMRILET